jgi:hypothetical protein
MTDEPFESAMEFEIEEVYETLRIRLPQMTIVQMDEEIAADPRYHGSRSEFVLCAVEYSLYCIPFGKGLEWIVEEPPEE